MLMDMDYNPTQIYGVPQGVHGLSASPDQLATLDSIMKTTRASIDAVGNFAVRVNLGVQYGRITAAMNAIGFTNLNDNQIDSFTQQLYALTGQANAAGGVPAAQPQPQAPGPQSMPGFFDSFVMGADVIGQDIKSALGKAFAPRDTSPEILPDDSPTVYMMKPLPPAQVVDTFSPAQAKAIEAQVGFRPASAGPAAMSTTAQAPAQGGSILDTLTSVFGGLTAAAPGTTQAALMFTQRPQRAPRMPKVPISAQRPETPWGTYLLIGGAVIAVGLIAYKVTKGKK